MKSNWMSFRNRLSVRLVLISMPVKKTSLLPTSDCIAGVRTNARSARAGALDSSSAKPDKSMNGFRRMVRVRSMAHRIQRGVVDRVNNSVHADEGGGIGLAQARGQRICFRKRVGSQIPAVELAVFVVGQHGFGEWIHGG